MTKTYHISDANYRANLVAVGVADATHTILVLAGIGETIKNYTDAQAKLGITWPDPVRKTMTILDARVVSKMEKKAEELKFNIVAVCTHSQYSKAEMLAAKKYAVDNWQTETFSVLAHSQGGYNLNGVMDDELANAIDGIVWVAPGPSNNSKLGPSLAGAKVASWFITSDLDKITAGDLGQVTENMHNGIIKAGGTSYLTLYDKTGVYNEHSILDYVLADPAKWPAQGNAASPKMSVYEFLLSNKKGQEPVAPTKPYKPVEEPVEEPPVVEPPIVIPPVPPKVEKALINALMVRMPGINDRIPTSVLNAGKEYKAADGQRCSGIMIEWTPEGNIYVMDIRDKDNYKLPIIKVGPFK